MWTDQTRVLAVRRWHPYWAAYSREVTEALVQALGDARGWHVLDVGTGSGEPALTLAQAVGPAGHVTASDLTGDVLGVAEENAHAAGLSNIAFREADAEKLPFPDASFDALTCRFGIMFVPDPARALRECLRVLKPRGRAVFAGWGPSEQPCFASTTGVLRKYVEVPADPPDVPGRFRFSGLGKLRRAMEEAGFVRVQEEICSLTLHWPGPAEQLCQYFSESAGPDRPYLEKVSPQTRQRLLAEVTATLKRYDNGREVSLPAQVIRTIGTRE
jgi:SAM-dependent methyltransferase